MLIQKGEDASCRHALCWCHTYAGESYVIRRRDNFKVIRTAKTMKDNTLALRESEKQTPGQI